VFNRLGREVSSSSVDTAAAKTSADKTVFKVTLQGMDDGALVPPTKPSLTKVSGKIHLRDDVISGVVECKLLFLPVGEFLIHTREKFG
jgi:hypothetical protein